MILKISEKISEETLEKLIAFYNEFNSKKMSDSEVTIYLLSGGGDCWAAEAMLDLINENSGSTTLIGYGRLSSSAFQIFFTSKCKKKLIGGCYGMYHQSTFSVDINEFGNLDREDECKKQYMMNYMWNRTHSLSKQLQFTEKEMEDISKGLDVYFSPERMQEFLTKQELVSQS